MTTFKKALRLTLCILPVAAVAGIFVAYYQIDTLPKDIVDQVLTELGNNTLLVVITALQTVLYAAVCGFFGTILADKLGLFKPFRFEKRALLITLAAGALGGAALVFDHFVFGRVIDGIQSANIASLSARSLIACVLYGGIIEEVMMRLFFLSLVAFLVWKLGFRSYDRDAIPTRVFVIANILAAMLFAAGHLPTAYVLFGGLTPLAVFRSFLFNGGLGLAFGALYRRYGIGYAMIAHALCHIVAKLLLWVCI